MSKNLLDTSLDIFTKKRKQHPSQGDDASTGVVAPGIDGREEEGEARRANTTPNGGPNLELERFRLRTLPNFGFSNGETTWETHLHIYLQIYLPIYLYTWYRIYIYIYCTAFIIRSRFFFLPPF